MTDRKRLGGVRRTRAADASHLSLVEGQPNPTSNKPPAKKPDVTAAHKVLREKDAHRRELRESGMPTPLERFRKGEYPVGEWTDDEVARGRPANRDGSFDGPWPNFTGKQQADIRRELMRRGQGRLDKAYMAAIDSLATIAKHGEKDSDRVKAADLLIQRVAGKVPDRVEIKSSDPWQDILDDIMNDEVLERLQDSQEPAG